MRNSIEFKHLEQFVAVARARNFTRAAVELNLSQSALSRSIQKLEEQVGQPLLERKPKEVIPTDIGELLLERSLEIMSLLEGTFALLEEAGKQGRIRLGAIPTIAPYFLPSLLRSFSEVHPNISIVVQEDTTDNLVRRCNYGELDLAILALPVAVKYLEVEALFDEELLLVLPNAHPLAACEEITPKAIESFPFVLLNEAHCLSETIASYCRQQSVQPVTVERISQLTTVQELVALDHGVSIIPQMARRLDVGDRRVYRSFSGEKPQRTVGMMWDPYRYQNRWVKQFMDHLRQHVRQDMKGSPSPAL